MSWIPLAAANNDSRPSARYDHGFTSAGDKLYVHGGLYNGNECDGKRTGFEEHDSSHVQKRHVLL